LQAVIITSQFCCINDFLSFWLVLLNSTALSLNRWLNTYFLGMTRNNFDGKKVIKLQYEAYTSMAEKELNKICQHIREKWTVEHICIYHRIGQVIYDIVNILFFRYLSYFMPVTPWTIQYNTVHHCIAHFFKLNVL